MDDANEAVETVTVVKSCATCKHLLGNRKAYENAYISWKCYHPKNISNFITDMVTGIKSPVYKVNEIYSLRELAANFDNSKCGAEGAWWEEYVAPNHWAISNAPSQAAQDVASGQMSSAVDKMRARNAAAKSKTISLEDI